MWSDNATSQVLLDFEDEFKTSPSSASAVKMPYLTCTLTPDQPPRDSNIIGTGDRSAAQPYFGLKPCLGELTGPIDLVAIGYILCCVFGDPTTTGSNPYTHVFIHGASTPSFLIDTGFTKIGQYYLFNGCKAKGLLIKLMEDKLFTYSLLIMAAKETPGESAYQQTPADVSLPETILGISDISVMLEGGLANTEIDELEIVFMNNSQIGFGLSNSGEGSHASEGSIGIEGRIRGLFTSDDLRLKGYEHTESSLSITFTAGNYSLKIDINELQYNHHVPIIDGPAGVYIDVTFAGYYQNNDNKFKVTLINGYESYIPVDTAWDIGPDEVV